MNAFMFGLNKTGFTFRGQIVGGGGGHVDPGGRQGRRRSPKLRGVCSYAHI